MALTVNEISEGRDAQETWDPNELRLTRRFLIQSTIRYTEGEEVLADANLPAKGAPYVTPTANNPAALVISRNAVNTSNDGTLWEATITYSTRIRKDPNELNEPDPTKRPPRYSIGGTVEQETVLHDRDGEPIVNSAGEFVSPLPTRPITVPTIQVERDVSSFDFKDVETYSDKVNSQSYLGFDPGSVYLERLTFEGPRWNAETEALYWTVRGTFKIKKRRSRKITEGGTVSTVDVDGWDLVIPDAGFVEKDGSDDTSRIVNSLDGTDKTGPQLLDGTGVALTTTEKLAAGNVVYLRFRRYDEVDFNALGLI